MGRCGHHNDLAHTRIEAFADVGSNIRLAGFDLKGDACAVVRGYEINGLAAANGHFLLNRVAATPEVLAALRGVSPQINN